MRPPDARTLPALLDEITERGSDREFLVGGGERWTYGAFREEVARIAGGLAARGIRRGDNIGLLMGNRPEWLAVMFAGLSLGARIVAVNTWFRTHELGHALTGTDVKLLVTADRYLKQDYLGMLREVGAFGGVDMIAVLGDTPPDALPYAALRGTPLHRCDAGPEDTALILFTSGTTSMPKGARLTHDGIIGNMWPIGERMRMTADDRVWLAVNLFWSFASANALGAALTHGAAIVLQHAFEPGEALELIERERCTIFYGLPNMADALLRHPDRARRGSRFAAHRPLHRYARRDGDDRGARDRTHIAGVRTDGGLRQLDGLRLRRPARDPPSDLRPAPSRSDPAPG